jgi:inward rectifier potassium channel
MAFHVYPVVVLRWKISFFALLYYAIGIEHLNGIDATGSDLGKFGQAYFFSAQTFTTVGYGHISPVGFLTSFSAAEALGIIEFCNRHRFVFWSL